MNGRSTRPAADATGVAVRDAVDRALLAFLAEQRRILTDADDRIAPIVDEVERTIRAGGKRLRPLFCYWGHRASGGGEGPEIIRAAASLEFLHTFALIHDDVMDVSPLRRGEPTSYRRLAAALPPDAPGDPARFGMSAAILAGDLAGGFAEQMLMSSGFALERLQAAARILHAMRAEVIGGQFLDLRAAATGRATPAETRRIGVLKSGGYTVEKPLLIGGALSGAGDDVFASLSRFGIPLGEAFQLRDDVLGAFGDPAVTGKDNDSDFREGKQTLLVALARERAAPADRAFLEDRLGARVLTREEVERIRGIIRASGALDETRRTIDGLRRRALAALDEAALPPAAAAALAELADLVVERES